MKKGLLVVSLFASAAIFPQVALGQDRVAAESANMGAPSPDQNGAANNDFQDIVVTARKSSESFMKVPVVMSAIDPTQIAQRSSGRHQPGPRSTSATHLEVQIIGQGPRDGGSAAKGGHHPPILSSVSDRDRHRTRFV